MNTKCNKELPELYRGIGKGEVVEKGIFERFGELIPAVGDNYWREDGKHRKMLLVGESNYFKDYPESVSVFKDAERWYKENTDKLIPEEMKTAVSNDIGYRTFNKVFKIMCDLLDERGVEHLDRIGETAFYNYFLRPAFNDGKNKGFKPQPIDKVVAGAAMSEIINRLKPDLVIFLSKKAFVDFDYYYKQWKPGCISIGEVNIQHVAHPSSIWWNRDGGERGKVKFRRLLEQYWFQ